MKYLAILILSLASVTANAQHHHGYYHHHHGHYNWVAPLVIGGIAGYAIANRPAPVVVQSPPNGVYSYPSEMIYIDGVAYRRERIYLNGVWQDVLIRL